MQDLSHADNESHIMSAYVGSHADMVCELLSVDIVHLSCQGMWEVMPAWYVSYISKSKKKEISYWTVSKDRIPSRPVSERIFRTVRRSIFDTLDFGGPESNYKEHKRAIFKQQCSIRWCWKFRRDHESMVIGDNEGILVAWITPHKHKQVLKYD
jgi:hypothetical protein